ncbi:penicillin acylase family protein [Nocardioides jishulii]|uniref:Penicillin acylase family protein n=1 Tax=Nocardioides jishulii TaxID=2575440 RepID=A0A4U2YTP0_9ACTN|nr:penicillin acylase family protein [Nocardioides jishulii]QCX28547.1 penicillin acylase family protein [Nocardioides jishulii]TKI64560.1 penicillin acylase family protein [Nocardioides jishulii]
MTTPTAPVTHASSGVHVPEASWWVRYRAWPTWAHVTTGLVLALVLLLVALSAYAVNTYRAPLPQTTGEADLPGLGGAVEVLRDEHGVPQIYADTDRDLVRAQGYVHAQERFFEMDVRRHATAGRLAELFGREALDSDLMVRTMGWRRVAEEELGLVSSGTRALLDAYADGVNAYLAQRDPGEVAVEYSVLGLTGVDHVPTKWSATDSLAWLKAMAWDLRGNMDDEVDRAVAALDNDADVVAALHPDYDFGSNLPIVRGGEVSDGRFEARAPSVSRARDGAGSATGTATGTRTADDAAREAGAALRGVRDAVDAVPALLGRGDALGSNSWVVAGSRTASGKPLLANDPHLGTSQPGIWMQMGMHCRQVTDDCTLDVAGFTFSGFPGVVIGHNAEVAWGLTNLGADVTDLYLERIDGDSWWHGGEARPLRTRTEVVKVRGEDDFALRVRETDHGPLISDVSQDASSIGANAAGAEDAGPYAVALRWTALDPGATADAVFALNRAQDWDDFRAAAALFDVPSQNLVYADRAGNIGYQAPGKIPVRKAGHDGRTPAAGWLTRNDWTGKYVPFEALPSVLNPDEGFIVTANQAVIGDDYPYFLTDDWDDGHRAQRIRDLLVDQRELTVDDVTRIQLDARNPLAPSLVPALESIHGLDPYVQEAVDLLSEWDGQDDADSAAAAYFHVVWERLLALTFHDDLRTRIHPGGGARWVSVVQNLLRDPTHVLWDDRETEETVEVRDDVLRKALVEARDEMTQRQARNPDRWQWGRAHRLELTHATLGTSGIGIVERIFNRDGGGIGGSGAVPNATAYDLTDGFTVTSAPSMRMVVDLADFDDSRWVNLTGVSGHPASAHYDDQVEAYVEGRTLPWRWSREEVRRASGDRLLLRPTE